MTNVKIYKFNDGRDMIDLAQRIQNNVYWHNSFISDDNELVRYKHLWDYIESAISEGHKGIMIDENDQIIFI